MKLSSEFTTVSFKIQVISPTENWSHSLTKKANAMCTNNIFVMTNRTEPYIVHDLF